MKHRFVAVALTFAALAAAPALQAAEPASMQMMAGPSGMGVVNQVDAERHVINLSHDPIASLGWPAMTMDFIAADTVDLSTVKSGDKVHFVLGEGEDGVYRIIQIMGGM